MRATLDQQPISVLSVLSMNEESFKFIFFVSFILLNLRFDNMYDAKTHTGARYFILRPEVVESYFVMWRITHDQKYRDWGWDVVLVII